LELLTALGFASISRNGAVTGDVDGLAFVSPKTGRAVSRAAGQGYVDRLLPLPAFLLGAAASDRSDHLAGLRLTGYFLDRMCCTPDHRQKTETRARFIDRLAEQKRRT